MSGNPAEEERRAREVLKAATESSDARLVLASALRRQDRAREARDILEPLIAAEPDSPVALLELGLTLTQLADEQGALDALGRAVDLSPTYLEAWCAIAETLSCSEKEAHRAPGARDTWQLALAELRKRRLVEAESLLGDLTAREPDYQPSRLGYAVALLVQEKAQLAIPVIDELLRREPENALYRQLKASALHETRDFRGAIAQYEKLLNERPDRPGAWISYGRMLQAIGRHDEAVMAFRRSIEILPSFAAGYRTLAMLKTVPMDPKLIEVLRGLLAGPGLLDSRRSQLLFALATALEDAGEHAEAFDNYQHSNRLQRIRVSRSASQLRDLARRTKTLFTPSFLSAHEGGGENTRGPIFVVGMPRAGSTLVHEILAAHSAVEGLGELRDLSNMAMRLRLPRPETGDVVRYPEVLGLLDGAPLRALGEGYLERMQPRRKSAAPFFVDKLPENFLHTGFIHFILPSARIIDVRRHPLDCCVSCFTNYLPEGPPWIHDLDELGRYYAAYVELMAHFDKTLPGRIHRIFYEQLVDDPETEVRRMLEYVGVPFEAGCLRFYEREQAIVTASADQARRAINREGVGTSRKFEPYLAPLKSALGAVLESYPAVPEFFPVLQTSFTLRLS